MKKNDDYQECEAFSLRNVGLKGTARSISVLKLLEDEEKEHEKCLIEKKRNLKKEN